MQNAGATGTDSNAPLLRAALAGAGVRLDHLGQTEGPSGTAVILLQPSGGCDSRVALRLGVGVSRACMACCMRVFLCCFNMIPTLTHRPYSISTTQTLTGENSIIIVGGANQDPRSWQLTDAARALLASAGALLLQREIPEDVNIAVAKVR